MNLICIFQFILKRGEPPAILYVDNDEKKQKNSRFSSTAVWIITSASTETSSVGFSWYMKYFKVLNLNMSIIVSSFYLAFILEMQFTLSI